jgi:hypothetical protein
LKKEYEYLQHKYQLKPIEKHLWKFLRTRPANFPTLRIAQFANLIYKSSALFSKIIAAEKLDEIRDLLSVEVSEYWHSHYVFDKETKHKNRMLGNSGIDLILINTIIPFMFVYGIKHGDDNYKNRAIDFLQQIKPESNKITAYWNETPVTITSAFYSQSLIQLTTAYCSQKRCLDCRIGNVLIGR